MRPKGANGSANRVNHDQTAPSETGGGGLHSLSRPVKIYQSVYPKTLEPNGNELGQSKTNARTKLRLERRLLLSSSGPRSTILIRLCTG